MQYFEAHDISEYKDADGKTPEILLIDGNRAAGKTTAFSRKLVNDFLESGKKFMLIYRYKNELCNIAEAFFKDIKELFFPEHTMTEKTRSNGAYIELFLDGKSCGYAAALNTAGRLKKFSHIFSDVQQMFFDEYQLENGYYINNEIEKFTSLHMTVARGQGSVVRFVPVYMCSNSVSIFNPYYDALGIAKRINSKTKVLKGSGFVLLRLTLKEVAKEQEKSAFNRAFSSAAYVKAATDNSFLNDESYNIMKRSVKNFSALLCFRQDEKHFILYAGLNDMHVKRGLLDNLPKYGVRLQDRNGEYTSIRNALIFQRVRSYYADGKITFEGTEEKQAFQNLIFEL